MTLLSFLLTKRDAPTDNTALNPSQDPVDYTLLAAFTAVAWVYAIELNINIFLTFKRKRGLYFWSLLISSWGLSLHALAFVLKYFVGTVNWIIICILITIGWYCMVTGQAFVLYSRLYLIIRNYTILRAVLAMIICNIFLLHVPTTIFTFGSNSNDAATWQPRFNIMERIQLVGFCLQETIISTIYVYATVKLLRSISHGKIRRVMTQLVLINLVCIGLDVCLAVLEFTNQYISEASTKPFFYAIKLKLEFAVLNQLMYLIKSSPARQNMGSHAGTGNGSQYDRKGSTFATMNSVDGSDEPNKADLGTWSFARAGSDPKEKGHTKPLPNHDGKITKSTAVDVSSEIALGPMNGRQAGTLIPAVPTPLNTVAPPAYTTEGGVSRQDSLATAIRNDSLMGTTFVGGPRKNSNRHLNGGPFNKSSKDSMARLNQPHARSTSPDSLEGRESGESFRGAPAADPAVQEIPRDRATSPASLNGEQAHQYTHYPFCDDRRE